MSKYRRVFGEEMMRRYYERFADFYGIAKASSSTPDTTRTDCECDCPEQDRPTASGIKTHRGI